jgi:two-component system cell cycle response regulator DivK
VITNPQDTIDKQFSASGQVRRILLIEGNDLNRQLLSEHLGYLGYEVVSLASGTHCFESLNQFRPQLILLNVKLPETEGYALLQEIQQRSDWQRVPIFVISALTSSADRQRALALGASQYFVKPIHLKALSQAIRELDER